MGIQAVVVFIGVAFALAAGVLAGSWLGAYLVGADVRH